MNTSELSWDIFHFDKSTNTVVFKNMATLALFSERIYGSYEEELGAALVNTLDLQFPKLENTIIAHMPVSVDVLQNLARSTRKSIVFSGPLASMVAMLDRPIRGLEYIELRWDSKFYLYEADNFVRLSNEALGRTAGIEWVNFTLRCKVPEFVLTGINWTHVTVLSLEIPLSFSTLLPAVLAMPNLVKLTIDVEDCEEEELITAVEYLFNIREYFAEPSTTKITNLRIFCLDGPAYLRLEEQIPLKAAFEMLTWLIPGAAIEFS
ncbi:hypothetical protein LPJ63_000004 [Coemansia sp. RSA 2711]|nr:hypothetical protein LPJ63_000004 [Coemansia sp. RSA 2711]